jgi:hypothetical protein
MRDPVTAPTEQRRRHQRDDRVLPYTRVLAAVLLPFLAVASVLLYLLPTRTDSLFAWTIAPPFTAMLLGCAYIGGIRYFVGVLRARSWHRIWTGMPAVLGFASLACAATFLHFDRFHFARLDFGRLASITWLVLYVTTPVLILILIVLNAPRDPRTPEDGDLVIPSGMRVLLGVVGVAAVATGVALFVAPVAMASIWAWPLTPLTARVTGGVIVLPGLVNVLLLVDARWSAFRLIFQAQLLSLVCIIAAVVIRSSDLLWSRPAAPLFAGSLVVSLVLYVGLVLRMRRAGQRATTHR